MFDPGLLNASSTHVCTASFMSKRPGFVVDLEKGMFRPIAVMILYAPYRPDEAGAGYP